MSSVVLHEREQGTEDLERYSKRQKFDDHTTQDVKDRKPSTPSEYNHILPRSHTLLGTPLPEATAAGVINFLETNVGISEYVGRESAKIEGIIKQRYVPCPPHFLTSLKCL
jgi:tRNA pseudouridine13 synthase